MNQGTILDLLENNARLTSQDLADILNEDKDYIAQQIEQLEKDKIICGYHTVINYNKAQKDQKVMAYIEVNCTPQRNQGYDKTALLIAKYPEVETMYLLSGDCDFLCLVSGKTMFEVARFVSDKIACVENVQSTKTLFVLKQYKQSGILMQDEVQPEEPRLVVTP
ncbi:DNA-binding Lrp family transcriptional regulator [Faecalicoccus acidiformans]|uniref:DNA-binding Lrp family transcriptional regulator n=1 Tax=Faecalicoccus acidiformans TaxID=915173 RepID=A0A7W8D1G6_9FIRM|nr:Lrp/AsnC family transcriptional regulator [Faecalicoccus acidiformans]MBB5185451.1 DNA-binding Lrp family transcriptional regulator [Faecalicoccus acidiformans]HIW18290.1 Lrp/AsnC family transcriptional regulator [Candidatus Faecalicoccus intestinipullorum]